MAPTFAEVQGVYATLWDELVPTPSRVPELEKICNRGLSFESRYAPVAESVWKDASLWWVVFLLDQMEAGGGANTHLWNGDPLSDYTRHVPADMPQVGHGPPFTFVESAIPALRHDGLDKVTEWTCAAVGYYFEKYNGWGYLSKPIVSPYIASWSNKYTKGKYVSDGVYDPNAISQQPGALTILKVLVTLDRRIELVVGHPSTTAPITPATPTKEPPVASSAAPRLNLDFSQLEPLVEQLLPIVASAFPPAAPFVPLIQILARTLLHAQPPAAPPA